MTPPSVEIEVEITDDEHKLIKGETRKLKYRLYPLEIKGSERRVVIKWDESRETLNTIEPSQPNFVLASFIERMTK